MPQSVPSFLVMGFRLFFSDRSLCPTTEFLHRTHTYYGILGGTSTTTRKRT
jgi:hypothetical protein